MIEAELKVRVRDPEGVVRLLEQRAAGRSETYRDTYYDTPEGTLAREDRELRLRTITGADGTRSVLTYKEPRVDDASGSKPEYETGVDNPEAVHAALSGLGYVTAIAFEKHCHNYDFEAHGRRVLATLVRVPELDGTFLEVEALARDGELDTALTDVRAVLGELGFTDQDVTAELYTEALAARRAR
ncbi:class IV adenylate cyclase [Streptomyces morookaense]|uniref:Class IV adenylate cyclase n=1 Tax=Streptomyces morookaense TaxID=1970 RepID=A0A7Y7B3V1_STRMO|nr:class IV adenylate cyclase [Streptomyces morookaense]NVK78101.1 class IV adenylate cyclase [Streptomyces morookaense]